MQFQAEIIDIGLPVHTPNNKGGYYTIEVAYKDNGQVKGKKLLDFVNKDVFNKVKELSRGIVITVTAEKDKNDYWQWVNVDLENRQVTKGSPESATKSTQTVYKNNYETPEERKIKQERIVRQSCIGYALTFAELAKISKPSVQGIIGIAQEFKAFVDSGDPVQDIVEMENDIPL